MLHGYAAAVFRVKLAVLGSLVVYGYPEVYNFGSQLAIRALSVWNGYWGFTIAHS